MVRARTRRARKLRRDATEAERILWRALRGAALPARVRRQHPIGRHIADFAVPSRKLVIEVDGGQHASALARDSARTRMLEARGWRVIRFWNGDVMSNLDGVLETIAAEIERPPSSPRPSPPRRGGEGE
ncbi:MAG: endonuclease domain-containing protein [Rhodospirillales bacterium]|nr:endonuclease domain-containing protein [Rhodospirillales bacterium]